MERDHAKRIIEALLYMTDHPLNEAEILEVLESKSFDAEEIKAIVMEIGAGLAAAKSPIQVVEVAGGVQMATQADVAVYIRRLYKERLTVKLSPSALETLAIIAYKQPISRSEIEQIRGVEASGVMDTLLERRLLKVVGRKETIGRPLLYGTSVEFLRQFGLKHLTDLPDPNTLVVAASTDENAFDATSAGAIPSDEINGNPRIADDFEPAVPVPDLSVTPDENFEAPLVTTPEPAHTMEESKKSE